MRISLLVFILLIPGTVSNVYGGTASVLGTSSRASAMCGAMTAVSNDYTAIYYNPALLSDVLSDDEWFQFGFTYLYTSREFEATYPSGEPPIEKSFNTQGYSLGLTFDLNRLVGLKNCHLGINFYMPSDTLLGVDIADGADTPYFPVYDELGTSYSLYMGFSYSLSKKVSVGLGSNILINLPATDTHIIAYLDANDMANTLGINLADLISEGDADITGSYQAYVAVNREIVFTTGLHAGVAVDMSDRVRLGFSYREELYGECDGYQNVYFALLNTDGTVNEEFSSRFPVIRVPMLYAMYYTPDEYSLGLGFKFSRFLIDVDLTYGLWSGYVGQHTEIPKKKFDDTLTPRIGIEYNLNPKMTLWAGYMWRPTPVPDQKGISNYMDSDTHTICFGGAYKIKRGSLQAHLQYHQLDDREIDKPGDLSDIMYEGAMWHTGVSYIINF